MALCAPGEGVASLAIEAARRALSRWHGDVSQIGLLAVGTETALDMSRPLSAWVADGLGLCGALRSYEVKHACYGGTLALRQALEWKLSGAAPGKAALVVAADVALYAEGDPGEPTQGAGAVAMIVDDDARLAVIDPVSFTHSEPAFDFWRPVGQPFPSVDGPLSLDCYKRATERCFAQLLGGAPLERVLESHAALAFHVPFPKMVRKAFVHPRRVPRPLCRAHRGALAQQGRARRSRGTSRAETPTRRRCGSRSRARSQAARPARRSPRSRTGAASAPSCSSCVHARARRLRRGPVTSSAISPRARCSTRAPTRPCAAPRHTRERLRRPKAEDV
jgi:hypothetical protein